MAFSELFPSLDEVLEARESRWNYRVSHSKDSVILSVTSRLPYSLRVSYPDLPTDVRSVIESAGFSFLKEQLSADGKELYFSSDLSPVEAKKRAVEIEETHRLGKFLDLDVCFHEKPVNRRDLGIAERKCIICGKPSWVCIKQKTHSVDEIKQEVENAIFPQENVFVKKVARLARLATEDELRLVYKPGLVTPLSMGSHTDMDFFLMKRSLDVLQKYWELCAKEGCCMAKDSSYQLSKLRNYGLEAEKAMFSSSGGVNTYKGLIYLLGILCACSAAAYKKKDFLSIFSIASRMCSQELQREVLAPNKARLKGINFAGARGEASAGFPLVKKALHFLKEQETKQLPKEDKLLNTLLYLVSLTEDSNVAGRGGVSSLLWLQEECKKILAAGGVSSSKGVALYKEFQRKVLIKKLSPGGAADLLSCTLFLQRFLPLFQEDCYES